MSDRTFDKLDWQLTKEHTRFLSAALGKPAPDFPDEEPAPAKRPPAPAPARRAAPAGRGQAAVAVKAEADWQEF
jgi:hypothetical protein